jgi:peptidoglycan/LPS O-acetylase OafA/YrhL
MVDGDGCTTHDRRPCSSPGRRCLETWVGPDPAPLFWEGIAACKEGQCRVDKSPRAFEDAEVSRDSCLSSDISVRPRGSPFRALIFPAQLPRASRQRYVRAEMNNPEIQAKTQRKYYAALASAQCFAAIIIMMRHYAFFLPPEFSTLSDAVGRLNFVEFFFAASGFVLVTRYRFEKPSFPGFIFKRLSAFYPLHVITAMFYAAMVLAGRFGFLHGLNERNQLSDLPYILSLTHAWGFLDHFSFNYPSWYLSAQFGAYLIFLPALFLLRRDKQWILIATAIAMIVALVAVSELPGQQEWTDWSYHFGVVRAVPTFLLGMLIGWNILTIRGLFRSAVPVAIIFLLTLAGMLFHVLPTISYCLLQVLLVLFLVAREANGLSIPVLSSPGLRPVHDLSFPLFLLHIPVATVLLSFLFKNQLHGWRTFFFISVTMAISILASAAYRAGMMAFLSKVRDVPAKYKQTLKVTSAEGEGQK